MYRIAFPSLLILFASTASFADVDVAYPSRAWQLNKQGFAIVKYDIDQYGKPQNIEVVKSEPEGFFERTAVNIIKSKTFPKGMPETGKQYRIEFKK